jgi:hypothetical protein
MTLEIRNRRFGPARKTGACAAAFLSLLVFMAGAVWIAPHARGATVVYSTGFEASEGYRMEGALSGQNGWLHNGSGGNGIVTNFFANEGQQAYIGYNPPSSGDSRLFVWRPINLAPVPTNTPLVRFSVLMDIEDSSNRNYDNFRWTVFNTLENPLFLIEFDNYTRKIYRLLDGTNNWVDTGVQFNNNVVSTLVVTMDFKRGRWNATFDGQLLATNQPLTTTNAPLNLGDVDAAWIVYDASAPGDNFMVFDNYRITAEEPRAVLSPPAKVAAGSMLLQLACPPGYRYAIDASTNFVNWTALKTNVATNGFFSHTDTNAVTPRRFYRGRWVP